LRQPGQQGALELATKDDNTSDHDLLIRLDEKMDGIIEANASFRKALYGENGQGGICGKIGTLENQQSRWAGRDGAILVIVPTAISIIGLVLMKGGW
jgi:hypothetical protein